MITLLGFFFIIGNVALQQYKDPDFKGPRESWVYYSYAIGVWAYQTMDNMDGKQARRTGMSSPLGELFDHGIDSLNCTLASLLMTSAVGLGSTGTGAFTAFIPTLPMFFSTWETYHTHTLYLGHFNGPTEGLIIASSVMVASGVYGPPYLAANRLPDAIGFSNIYGGLTSIDLWIWWLLAGLFVAHLPGCLWNVYSVRKRDGLPFVPLLMQWTPMLVFCGSLVAWIGSPYSTLLEDNHLCLLCLTLSFVFGRMTTKIILAHLTRQPFPYWTTLLLPLIAGAVLVNLPYLGFENALSGGMEHFYLWAYFVLALIVYFRWAYLVINAICNYLGIPCFTIPEEKWKPL